MSVGLMGRKETAGSKVNAERYYCLRLAAANEDGWRGLQKRLPIRADWLLGLGVDVTEVDCGDGRLGNGPQLTGVAVQRRIKVAGLPQTQAAFEAIARPLRKSRDGVTVPVLILGIHTYCAREVTVERALERLTRVWGIMPQYTIVKVINLKTGRISFACYIDGEWSWYDHDDLELSITNVVRSGKGGGKRMTVALDIANRFGWADSDGYRVAQLLAFMMIYNHERGYTTRASKSMKHKETSVMVGLKQALNWLGGARYSHASSIFSISLPSLDECWKEELALALPIPIGMAREKELPYLPIGVWVCGEPNDPKVLKNIQTLDGWVMSTVERMAAGGMIPSAEWCRPFYVVVDETSLAIRDCDCIPHEQLKVARAYC